jgi:hypothetical protein
MRRLFAFIWLALALSISTGPAFAAASHDCPMTSLGQMQAHQAMGCCEQFCSADCSAVCPAAVEPSTVSAAKSLDQPSGKPAIRPSDALASADLSGTDPPPRITFS